MGERWRHFRPLEIFDAYAWVEEEGGVAVHENLIRFRGQETAHLLAGSLEDLIEAAVSLGVDPTWIQNAENGFDPRRTHFDLFGEPLHRARRRAGPGRDGASGRLRSS